MTNLEKLKELVEEVMEQDNGIELIHSLILDALMNRIDVIGEREVRTSVH